MRKRKVTNEEKGMPRVDSSNKKRKLHSLTASPKLARITKEE